MYLAYHPSSTDFWMGKANEDPKMTDFVNRQRRELDNKKREQIFQDFVKYDVEKMYYIPYHFPVDTQPYYVAQPTVGGWGWWQPYIEQNPAGGGQILLAVLVRRIEEDVIRSGRSRRKRNSLCRGLEPLPGTRQRLQPLDPQRCTIVIKRITAANENLTSGRSREEAQHYWAETHGKLVANSPTLNRYHHYFSLPEAYASEPKPTFIGISMFWRDDPFALPAMADGQPADAFTRFYRNQPAGSDDAPALRPHAAAGPSTTSTQTSSAKSTSSSTARQRRR